MFAGGKRVDIRAGAHRVADDGAFAGGVAQFQSHRLNRQQQVGKNDGRVDVQNLDRLQRDRSRQVGPLADLENAVLRADFAVLAQIAACLPHEPYRPHVRRAAPAGIQKTAVH